ncbi:GNAT family N-acetyltransferase [Actinoplanes sp. NBRC 101535]|uniref:GNAT family N-acetyltransferase n=1 Tax=Actinoplanes sp. NBRC 101535 TaxID=3032196 RepID=UPI0024A1AADE|nr:GNAT family N-acetyltransferase [Actinoplanes sp. NBRC 101535]GLY05965.1 GCN5 family N-acetyltransferase [Actinoplanes sp. NBRC 101535]
MIRAARADDLVVLQEIEVAAGRAFAAIGMDAVARDEPLPVDELSEYQRDGRAWVAVDAADRPVAYAIAKWVDGLAHVEQVSTHPDHAGHRIGAALIDRIAGWAREHGSPALTLTTFADVAWNAPYYERLGFRRLADDAVTPGLRAIRAEENAHGLDRWPRLVMRREI